MYEARYCKNAVGYTRRNSTLQHIKTLPEKFYGILFKKKGALMNDLRIITHFLFVALCSGLFGLAMMSVVIRFAAQYKLTTTGPVQAIGSLFSGKLESAHALGWIVHVFASILFGMLYTIFLSAITPPFPFLYIPISALLGAAHGFVVFFLLIPGLAEHHPIAIVREEGSAISVLYVIAHIAYGTGVGAVFLLLTQGV